MMTWRHTQEWLKHCSTLVQYEATEENPDGLAAAANWYTTRFEQLGFSVKNIENKDAPYRPLLVAVRPPENGCKTYVGFFQHYDVEPVQGKWDCNPWALTERELRAYGRGMADNIGPFIQRLLFIEHTPLDVGLVFVVQGEEEIGSPFADIMYPMLELPEVALWIEETGYFYKNGSQRVMTVGNHGLLDDLVNLLETVNNNFHRDTRHRKRPLNKAFGAERCPCLAHLLKGKPYISIGPNDDHSTVHGPNESISIKLLEESAAHLKAILEHVGALK